MNWLVIDAATAESIRNTDICEGQHLVPIPLQDGTFYIADHPAIRAEDRQKAILVQSDNDYAQKITPLLLKIVGSGPK